MVNAHDLSVLQNKYAKGFQIKKGKNYSIIEISNPWQKAKDVRFTYLLTSSTDISEPDSITEVIKTPVQNVICLSTTHIAFIDALHKTKTIKAISGKNLISNAFVRNEIIAKHIFDVGYENNLNYELIIGLKPDVVFAYGIGAEVSGTISKLKEMGIKVVMVSEYLETHPLAKAEWIKFFACFFENEKQAEEVFDSIDDDYQKMRKLVSNVSLKPKVISSMPFQGTWYVSGGKSYAATLINDAGGNYIWNDLDSKESMPIDYETVYQKSVNADIWINTGAAITLSDIEKNDGKLCNIKPYKTGEVYNYTARITPEGGNDYWESGTVFPNLILKDLIYIFHPNILPNYKMFYYKKLIQ